MTSKRRKAERRIERVCNDALAFLRESGAAHTAAEVADQIIATDSDAINALNYRLCRDEVDFKNVSVGSRKTVVWFAVATDDWKPERQWKWK